MGWMARAASDRSDGDLTVAPLRHSALRPLPTRVLTRLAHRVRWQCKYAQYAQYVDYVRYAQYAQYAQYVSGELLVLLAASAPRWREAIYPDADLRPLRAALDGLSLEPKLLAWVRTASDLQLREQFLGRVEWVCAAVNLADRAPVLVRPVATRAKSVW